MHLAMRHDASLAFLFALSLPLYSGRLAMASTVINVSPREKAAAVCRIITGRKRGDGTFSALGRVIYREAAAGHRLAFSVER